MADSINDIDAGQTKLEDQLLTELQRLRKLSLETPYAVLDTRVQGELQQALDAVRSTMESAGDFTQLRLETDHHDQIRDRMRVLDSLLTRKIPTVFIEDCFQAARAHRIKPDAPHFAARVLLLLDQQLRCHHDDGQSIDQVMNRPASFDAKDLTRTAAPPISKRKVAQSPEEIRRKLAAKGASAQGKASFGSKDIEPLQPTPKPEKKSEPALKGPAIFDSKDIEPLSDIAQRQKQRREEAAKKAKAAEPAGKAVFLSRDLDQSDK